MSRGGLELTLGDGAVHSSVFSEVSDQELSELGWDLQEADSHVARQTDASVTRSHPPNQTDIIEVAARESDCASHCRPWLKHSHQLGAEASRAHVSSKCGAPCHRHPEPLALAR